MAGEEKRVVGSDEKHRSDGDFGPLVSPTRNRRSARSIDVREEHDSGEIVPERGEENRRKVSEPRADRDEGRSPDETQEEK